MNQLTEMERALLKEFETLAQACGSALGASEKTSEQLLRFSSDVKVRFDQIERTQSAIRQQQQRLNEALAEQSRQTETLVASVNALLSKLGPSK